MLIDSALGCALLQCLLPLWGYWRKNNYFLALARPCALLQSFLIANAFLLLIMAFVSNDFSIAYVAKNSHPTLPFFYRLTAVWGAHEGSFLLWIFLLDLWTTALCFFSKTLDREVRALSLAFLGLISFCFLLFLSQTSNPFTPIVNAIPQDLNPLLQDPGFFVHPPMLYAGYVGFSAVFAITMGYLVKGSIGSSPHLSPLPQGERKISSWACVIRPWVLAAWAFLTLGITLGSWWAYHVLGWGGFWFWDPVENASLLPWLAGAALLHLIIVSEKQERFLGWAVILAILTFSLSILGTFLVRSGVLISVHSFASDPTRGSILLLLLAFITGSALALQIYRSLKTPANTFRPFFRSSREAILLVQSVLLSTAMATVLLGTLYPLMMEAIGLGALSVGPPYFNQVLFPLLLLCLLMMGWAPLSQWSLSGWTREIFHATWRQLALSMLLSIGLTLFFARQWNTSVMLNLSLILWVLLSVRKTLFKQATMTLAHIGFALVILSIVLSTAFSKEREVRLQPGETVDLGPYVFQFLDVQGRDGPNYRGVSGSFAVLRHNKPITTLESEKRIYAVRGMVMTKVGIYPGVFHDLYLALGEPLTDNAWSVRLYYKPFIRWVWLGGFCIALSGFLALLQLVRRRT
jgi:cytochrome c-type biogenesis protein CcmF